MGERTHTRNYRLGFWLLVALGVGAAISAAWAVDRLGGWRYTLHRLYTQEAWPTFTQRMSQLELLPIAPGGVVLLGDSHVAYGEWSELMPGVKVYNRGVPGAGVEDVAAFAKTLPLHQARVVVIQIGTNDLLFHGVDEVVRRYHVMLEGLRQATEAESEPVQKGPGPCLIVCTLPGVANDVRWTGIDAASVGKLNDALREQVPMPRVELFDLATVLSSEAGVLAKAYTDDGVHLRGAGYRIWADSLAAYLAPGMTFVH